MHILLCLRHHGRALRDVTAGDFNQRFDILRGLCAAVRQVSDLFRNDRKTFSMVARSCRLNGRVERQNIGLECNAVNQRNDLRHLLGAFGNGLHIVGNLPHQLPALTRLQRRHIRLFTRQAGVIGVIFSARRHLLHAGCGLH